MPAGRRRRAGGVAPVVSIPVAEAIVPMMNVVVVMAEAEQRLGNDAGECNRQQQDAEGDGAATHSRSVS